MREVVWNLEALNQKKGLRRSAGIRFFTILQASDTYPGFRNQCFNSGGVPSHRLLPELGMPEFTRVQVVDERMCTAVNIFDKQEEEFWFPEHLSPPLNAASRWALRVLVPDPQTEASGGSLKSQ